MAANSSAYPTSITNALGQATNYTYDSCTGTISAITDPNSVTFSYTYDALSRVLCSTVTDADHTVWAKKCDAHADSAPSTLTETVSQTATQSLVTQLTFDGYGRTVRSALSSDPDGADFTDTTYDALGRLQSVSNPYRTVSDLTYGITSFSYDALARKIYQCQPDNTLAASISCTPTNSFQSWGYANNMVTLTDELGNQSSQITDALGRLVKVLEPNGTSKAPTMETDYLYDALNNLFQVDQYGGAKGNSSYVERQRKMRYNGLSQLIQSYNPESGWICYGSTPSSAPANGTNCTGAYDGDGNLLSKVDGRGVAISYAYDWLNRLTQKAYNEVEIHSQAVHRGGLLLLRLHPASLAQPAKSTPLCVGCISTLHP